MASEPLAAVLIPAALRRAAELLTILDREHTHEKLYKALVGVRFEVTSALRLATGEQESEGGADGVFRPGARVRVGTVQGVVTGMDQRTEKLAVQFPGVAEPGYFEPKFVHLIKDPPGEQQAIELT